MFCLLKFDWKQQRQILLEQYRYMLKQGFFIQCTLDYIPNTDALRIIITELLPD
jgi:hypothetical protein